MSRLQNYRNSRLIRNILDTYEFVYFGNIDKDDEYMPIHGITASVSHKDRNFSAGTVDKYNIRVVNREDKYTINKSKIVFNQIIIELSLKKFVATNPTLILGAGHDSVQINLLKKMTSHHHILPSEKTDEIHEFHSRYRVYCHNYTDTQYDSWLDLETQQVLSTHSWPFSFELDNKGKLYVYISDKLKEIEFERALKIGVWLADKLDS